MKKLVLDIDPLNVGHFLKGTDYWIKGCEFDALMMAIGALCGLHSLAEELIDERGVLPRYKFKPFPSGLYIITIAIEPGLTCFSWEVDRRLLMARFEFIMGFIDEGHEKFVSVLLFLAFK